MTLGRSMLKELAAAAMLVAFLAATLIVLSSPAGAVVGSSGGGDALAGGDSNRGLGQAPSACPQWLVLDNKAFTTGFPDRVVLAEVAAR